jgi:hypothetical protein
MSPITDSSATLNSVTEPSSKFVTTPRPRSCVIALPKGRLPTRRADRTLSVAVAMT